MTPLAPENVTDNEQPRLRARYARFSIRGLFLTLCIVILSASHLLTSLQLRTARQELNSLRNDAGWLEVADPKSINVIAIPSYEHLTFRWRVHLPAGGAFKLMAAEDGIRVGLPAQRADASSVAQLKGAGREFIIAVAIHRDHNGNWCYGVDTSDGVLRNYPIANAMWLENVSDFVSSQVGKNRTESSLPGSAQLLLTLRRPTRTATGWELDDDTPTDGLVFWIEVDR